MPTTRTKEMIQVNLGLQEDAVSAIVERLDTLLADEHVLYAKTRNFHWNVTGMQFEPLHELFEAQYNSLKAMADEIAERTRKLGRRPAGTLRQFLDRTRIAEADEDTLAAEDMIAALLQDHEQVIRALRSDIDDVADEFGDEGTADLLIGVIRSHEEMAWMLRSMLE